MAQRARRRRADPVEVTQASSTLVGAAFTMPDDPALEAVADEAPIDFQARQDSISPTRRAPGGLMPKVKRTKARPSRAKETKVKL
ncbi:MAG: hypothetical protein M3177_07625 [Pseudomonadota bacterium]|nr:hypothetical protein [Pseudomonadota bacterium]